MTDKITRVHGHITGVDNDVFFTIKPSTTRETHVAQRITPSTTRETHVVWTITTPQLVRQLVEVEDVDRIDKDEGEEQESNIASQNNVGGNQVEVASEAEAPQLGCGHMVQTQPDY